MWNHPIGRIATQFKTFAFGQARLIRDLVLTEAAHGNFRPLAYFISLTPIAGEMVADIKAIIGARDRDKSGVWRGVENTLYAGGFGIAHDLITAARQGRLMGSLFGPAVNDAVGLAERMAQGDVEGIIREFTRQPATRAAITLYGAGVVTEEIIDDYLEHYSEESTPTYIDLGTLRQQEANRKRP
jgi:hypothetical protein